MDDVSSKNSFHSKSHKKHQNLKTLGNNLTPHSTLSQKLKDSKDSQN